MNILGLDTSGAVASCAIINEKTTIGEFTTNHKINHSETFLPLIDSLLKSVSMDLKEIDYIAVSTGPGSFTGLRIGAAIAMSFAHALGIKILPVPALDGLAYNMLDSKNLVIPIMDARRNQVYSAIYENSKRLTKYLNEDIYALMDIVNSYKTPSVFLGDGVFVHKDLILTNSHKIAPLNNSMQRASSVAFLGLNLIKENKAIDYNKFELMYLRKTQAEREYSCSVLKTAQQSAVIFSQCKESTMPCAQRHTKRR